MPRAFDSDNPSSDLVFTENVECPRCGEVFEGEFQDPARSLSVQDMVETPESNHECPVCGCVFISVMTGWMFFGEAG